MSSASRLWRTADLQLQHQIGGGGEAGLDAGTGGLVAKGDRQVGQIYVGGPGQFYIGANRVPWLIP
jgi:hypothetical protein